MNSVSTSPSAALSLPTGGGAVQGIGESFQAAPFTGTSTQRVPLGLSPGRHGFGPQLSLSYAAGTGNGLFGLGWSLDLARISRKTERGLPRYDDDRDTFLLAGAEDLVRTASAVTDPQTGETAWQVDAPGVRDGFTVFRYRPRTEGPFARIERWVAAGTGETHWRTITPDNTTHLFGLDDEARIADPADPRRVCDWLLQESQDAYGNHVRYEYAADDPVLHGDDAATRLGELFERRRRATQRYPRRILYANLPASAVDGQNPVTYPDGSAVGVSRGGRRYAFEVVFDYGDWDRPTIQPHPAPPAEGRHELFGPDLSTVTTGRPVPVREDRFSAFRSGFEVRTLRRCERVLMFHHFAELGAPTLVRSTDLAYAADPDTRMSMLQSVTLTSHVRGDGGAYRSASLPPLGFGYSTFELQAQRYQSLQARGAQMPTLPLGDPAMALVDLVGDGLPDLVRSTGAGWQVWRNLGDGRFDRPVMLEGGPAGVQLGQPGVGFGDMSGSGVVDLLVNAGDLPGFFETTGDGGWHRFTPYATRPAFDPADPNVRMVDLTGDGRADALLTRDEQFLWFACAGAAGFEAPRAVTREHDLDTFPDVFFDDAAGRVRLADMTGDGLQDIVLVHDGAIDYWPNLGYGRFGARIRMAGSPRLETDFDPRRLFLADVNGTGCADVVYVDLQHVQVWCNQSGNAFGERRTVTGTPRTIDPRGVQFADVYGSGTTAIVWGQDRGGGQADGMYQALDLCGGAKPYLLTTLDNHLGALTRMAHGPSTRHQRRDRDAGTPWLTTLPFPVQVVEQVETLDLVARTRHVVTYRYHHGYYDGHEREFRGFARVDQFDTQSIDDFDQGGAALGIASFENADPAFHVPPVETRTWFHAGLLVDLRATKALDARDFAAALRAEYYAGDTAFEPLQPNRVPLTATPADATRALRGAVLRTEVYGLDATSRAAHPYQAGERRHEVRELQPALTTGAGTTQPGVYVAHAIEQLSLAYERRPEDPRITHTLTLAVDDFGQVLRQVDVAYGRRRPDPTLPTDADREAQARTFVSHAELRFAAAVDTPDAHRLPASSESLQHELTGFVPDAGAGARFTWEEFADDLARIDGAAALPYEQPGDGARPERRLLKHTITRYRSDDLATLLPPGVQESLALPGQTFQLAFTDGLVAAVYGERVDDTMLAARGYLRGDDGANWWAPSGEVFLSPGADDPPADELAHAQAHFFMPCRARDAFGNTSTSTYDPYDLLVLETRDALANTSRVDIDYRLLQPGRLTDANGNLSQVVFDSLGLVAGVAAGGKEGGGVGDSLEGLVADLDDATLAAFLADPQGRAAALLGGASSRTLYDVGRFEREGEPCWIATLAREQHVGDLAAGAASPVQVEISWRDGRGRELQKKRPAEAGPIVEGGPVVDERWVGSGWTIVDNKDQPVRTFEPFFDDGPGFRFDQRVGASTTAMRDALGRVVATLQPDHSWTKVVFDAWGQQRWDAHDTVLVADPSADADVGAWFARLPARDYLPTWYGQRQDGSRGEPERDAAAKAAAHADTPSRLAADALSRPFLTLGLNRFVRDGLAVEEQEAGRVTLDIESQPREQRDALDRLVARIQHDLRGGVVHHAGMDGGERRQLPDAAGQPALGWDSRGQRQRTEVDALRRAVASFVTGADDVERQLSATEYGEAEPDATAANLRGRIVRRRDTAGLLAFEAYDFKGNAVVTHRQVTVDHRALPDWQATPAPALDPETFTQRIRFDALNRAVEITTPDGSVTRPQFNRAGLLARVDATLAGASGDTSIVAAVDYDARGQRTALTCGNGVRTEWTHDPLTWRTLQARTLRGATVLQDLAWTWDALGHVTRVTDASQQTVFFRNQVVTPDRDYTYDALYRLVRATGREHIGQVSQPQTSWDDAFRIHLPHPNDGQAMRRYEEAYGYDVAGNLLSLAHQAAGGSWTRTQAYGEASALETGRSGNRLTSVTLGNAGGVGDEAFRYDAHGNTTAMSHLPEMAWDALDRLQRAVLPGDATAFYLYDGAGQRVRKVVEKNGGALVEERISLDGWEVFRRRNAAGDVLVEHRTLHVADDRRRIALVETRTIGPEAELPSPLVRYQQGDHLGSATLELDGTGQVITYEEYYPYGCTSYQAGRSGVEVSLKRYRFTGMERDEETGLGYHGARYYAPWLARWASCDPAGTVDGANLYRYARNCPTVHVDPKGTDSQSPPTASPQETLQYAGCRADGLQEICYWNTAGGGYIAQERERVSLAPGMTAYFAKGAKSATAFLDPATDSWIPNETIRVEALRPVEHGNGGVIGGVLDSLFNAAHGLATAAANPKRTASGLWHMGSHPIQTAKALGGAIKQRGKEILGGDAHAVGETFGDVATVLLAPETEVAEGARAVKALDELSQAIRRPAQLVDSDVVINATKGSQNGLEALRATESGILNTQRSELINAGTQAQGKAMTEFLAREGIATVETPSKFFLTEAGPRIWDVIDTVVQGGHSPNDAILAAFSAATDMPFITAEKRLFRFFTESAGRKLPVKVTRVPF